MMFRTTGVRPRASTGHLKSQPDFRAYLERCLFRCKKLELAVDGIRLTSPAASTVTSVALQMMSFLFVGQLDVKNVLQATNQLGAVDRKEDFDSMTQVPSHEVGAAE